MKKKPKKEKMQHQLALIRKQRGLSQSALAKLLGVSRRVVAYCETEASNLPARFMKPLAESLNVTTDELLGLKKIKQQMPREEILLWKRFKKIHALSVRDRKALFHYLNALLKKQQTPS